MTKLNRSGALALALAVLSSLVVAAPSSAQLAHASASTLGLAGNHTATARGFGAISVNPAGLGMPGSGFSLAIAPVQVRLGLAPITLGDVAEFEGRIIPGQTKEVWLQEVIASGGETGTFGGEATALALTIGNIGFQFSSTARGLVNLPPGVVEAMLYGNAGRTGSATDLSLVGAAVEGYALSTAAFAFALPINPALVFGLTAKYTFGHALAVGESLTGSLEANPVRAEMEFPMITSCQDEVVCTQDYAGGGSGFGLDLGAIVDLGGITLGATLQNIISSFAWDESTLAYRPGTLLLDDGEVTTEYDEFPFDQAPDELKAMVDDFTLKPSVRLGAAIDVSPMLTVTGDIRGRLADAGMALEPNYSTGVGAELRLGFLHLRGGLTKISEGMQYGGGASLVLGPVNLSAAAGLVKGELSDAVISQVGLSFGHR